MTTDTRPGVPASLTEEAARTARRARGLFLAAFAGFVGIVITSTAIDIDRDAAQRRAADELGVNLNHLPADVLADILRRDSSTVATVLNLVLATAGVVLFTAAIRALVGVAGKRDLMSRAAIGLSVLGGAAWLAMNLAELALRSEPDWLVDNWWIYLTLVAIFVLAACGSLILAVVRVTTRTGLARRTGIVVVAICGLTIVVQLAVGAPPIVPMLLGAVYASAVDCGLRRAV